MAAILDRQNGRRYGQVQFINEVVDFIRSPEGRRLCYELLEALQAGQAGTMPETVSVTLGSDSGIPAYLQGTTYDLVDGEGDAERFDRQWREERGAASAAAEYLKPGEAADLLRVNPRTVKRWLQEGRLTGFQTPGGHWRVMRASVEALQAPLTVRERGAMKSSAAVAEIDLGPCASCGAPILAGQEYVSMIEVDVDGTIDRVRNRHVGC